MAKYEELLSDYTLNSQAIVLIVKSRTLWLPILNTIGHIICAWFKTNRTFSRQLS
jgi:hypothetical protein